MEDKRLRRDLSEIIKEWKNEAGVEDIILIGVYADFRDTIKICTNKPGWMIGRGGELSEKLLQWAKNNISSIKEPQVYFRPLIDYLEERNIKFKN